jgi:tol-pal system protein YbgF
MNAISVRWRPWCAVAATAISLAWPAHNAQAGLFDDEEARKAIVELRSRLDQQQKVDADLTEQLAVLRRSVLDLNTQIETLRGEIARLRGNDEQAAQTAKELARDVAELQRRQKDVSATLDDRLRRFEPQKVNLDGREVMVDPAEKKAYDDALTILRRGEFANAVAALQGFDKRFPASPYSGHVQYWLGNALYGKGDVKEALAAFRSLVSTTPDHPRAAEALLGLANCQVELKDIKGARKSLEDLVKTYPQSDAAQAGRDRLARLK